jgi:hypothetical protein
MEYIKRIATLIASLALLLFTVSFLIAVYHSTRRVTASDIESVEKSLQKVEAALKETDSPEAVLSKFKSENARLQADVQVLSRVEGADSQLKQKAIDDINGIILSLTTLQTQWGHERETSRTAISESLSSLKALRERLEPTATLEKVVGKVLTWIGEFVFGFVNLLVALAWPLVAIFIFWYLFNAPNAPDRVAQLFKRFKSFELGPAKFQLSDEVKVSLEETFAKYRQQVKEQYDQSVKKKSLDEKLKQLLASQSKIMAAIDTARKALTPDRPALQDHRCTIHVPDLLFDETFYQLLDYLPRQADEVTRGRTWSYRFGFMGRVWRSEDSDLQGTVSTNINELINNWGMTKDEASAAGKGRKSFLGVLLKYNEVPVGLFYMDSKEENAFGRQGNTTLFETIQKELNRLDIIKDLAAIKEDLSEHSAKIRIYTKR